MARDRTLSITLRLRDINHLFEEPNITPFSEYYAPYSFKTGMDYIVGELYAQPGTALIRLTVQLPAESITPNLEERTREAIRKYSAAWVGDARQEMAKDWYMGTRALWTGLIAVLVLVPLIYYLETVHNYWLRTLSHRPGSDPLAAPLVAAGVVDLPTLGGQIGAARLRGTPAHRAHHRGDEE